MSGNRNDDKDVDQKADGYTRLHVNATNGHLDVVKVLLEAGADVNQTGDEDGQTALHMAAFNGHLEVVRELLPAGADINQTDPDGRTALHMAAYNGHLDVVQVLLEAGAGINQTDSDGQTALDFANTNKATNQLGKYLEIIALFEDWGAIGYGGVHTKIFDLWFQLGYEDTLDEIKGKISGRGLCHGFSVIGAIDCGQEGDEGVTRFNKKLSILKKYSTDELVDKIKQAETIRKNVHDEFKIKQATTTLPASSLTEKDYKNIIATVLKAEFDNLNLEEENDLIEYFLPFYIKKYEKYESPSLRHPAEKYIIHKIKDQLRNKEEARLTSEALNKAMPNEGELILEIVADLENAGIAHNLLKNVHLLEEELRLTLMQQNAALAFHFAKKNGLIKPEHGTFLSNYNVSALESFFENWQTVINEQNRVDPFSGPVILFLGNGRHATFVQYFPNRDNDAKWLIFDINKAPAIYEKHIKNLALSVMDSHHDLDKKDNATIQTAVFSSKNDVKKLDKCISNLNQSDRWNTLHAVTSENAEAVLKVAVRGGDVKKTEDALSKRETNFFSRNMVELTLTGLSVGAGVALITVASILTLGVLPLIGGIVCVVLGAMVLIKTINDDSSQINISKEHATIEKTIRDKQAIPNSHHQIRSVLELIPQSRTAYKEKCNELNGQLIRKLDLLHISNHGKDMRSELKMIKKNSSEIVLSRTLAHAFDARYYPALTSRFFRPDKVNNMYTSATQLVDIDKTITKIEQRILELNNKVHGFFAGTSITIDDKEITVSEQVAKLYQLMQVTKTAPRNQQLKRLAKVLHFAKNESSFLTSDTSSIVLRDAAVWQFFGQINEMLVVRDHARMR